VQKLLDVTPNRSTERLTRCARATGLATSLRGAEPGRGEWFFRWFANLLGTASERKCTTSRICRITANPGAARDCLEGMVIAVEPMVNAGRPDVRMRDEWTAENGGWQPFRSFRAHHRDYANGPWILTRPKEMTGPAW